MPTHITCPKCGRVGKTSTEPAAGSKIRCPGCKGQFAYQAVEDFAVVEPPPGAVKPHEWPKVERDDQYYNAWKSLAVVAAVIAGTVFLLMWATKGGDAAGGVVIVILAPFVVASPLVLLGCVAYLVVKHATKQALREHDAEKFGR